MARVCRDIQLRLVATFWRRPAVLEKSARMTCRFYSRTSKPLVPSSQSNSANARTGAWPRPSAPLASRGKMDVRTGGRASFPERLPLPKPRWSWRWAVFRQKRHERDGSRRTRGRYAFSRDGLVRLTDIKPASPIFRPSLPIICAFEQAWSRRRRISPQYLRRGSRIGRPDGNAALCCAPRRS
jgi:hypothetical protein